MLLAGPRNGEQHHSRRREPRSLVGAPSGWFLGGVEWMASTDAEYLIDQMSDGIWEVFPQSIGSEPYKAHLRAAAEHREVRLRTHSPVLGTLIDVCIQPLGDGLAVYFCEHRRGGEPG